jgi:hypothetical protein
MSVMNLGLGRSIYWTRSYKKKDYEPLLNLTGAMSRCSRVLRYFSLLILLYAKKGSWERQV